MTAKAKPQMQKQMRAGLQLSGRLRSWGYPRGPREQDHSWGPEDRALSPEHYSQALRPNRICPAGLLTCFRTVTPLFLPFCPFRVGIPNLCLSHHCILEAEYLSGFTGPWTEMNLVLGWNILRALLTPGFDYLDNDT